MTCNLIREAHNYIIEILTVYLQMISLSSQSGSGSQYQLKSQSGSQYQLKEGRERDYIKDLGIMDKNNLHIEETSFSRKGNMIIHDYRDSNIQE